MLKHYVEFYFPGSFFSETSVKEVTSRSAPVDIPKGAYGYCFYSQEEIEQGGEILVGKVKDRSPMTYFGEILTLEQVKALEPAWDYRILVSYMENNKWERVVRTVRGGFQPLREGDRVVTPS
jgi:hypothetical protein